MSLLVVNSTVITRGWRLVALASGAVSRILARAPSPAIGWIVKRSSTAMAQEWQAKPSRSAQGRVVQRVSCSTPNQWRVQRRGSGGGGQFEIDIRCPRLTCAISGRFCLPTLPGKKSAPLSRPDHVFVLLVR